VAATTGGFITLIIFRF